MALKFLTVTQKSIPIIQELAQKSWRFAYRDILSPEQINYMLGTMYSQKELRSHILLKPNYHYKIIAEGDLPVGFIGYEFHYEPNTTKLHRIYLVPESQGRGFGKNAINCVKNESVAVGDSRMILNVNKNNPAKKFYEKLGFNVYDEGVFDIGNSFIMDDYLMELIFEKS